MQEGDRLTTYYDIEGLCTEGKRPVEEFIDDLVEKGKMEPITTDEIQLTAALLLGYNGFSSRITDVFLIKKSSRTADVFLTKKYDSYEREGKDINSRIVLIRCDNGVDMLFLGLFVGDNTEVKADNLGVGVLVQKQERDKRETIFSKNKEGSFVPISEEDRESVNDGILIELNKAKESLFTKEDKKEEDKYEIELREKLSKKLGVEYIGMFGDNNATFAKISEHRYKLIDKEGNELSGEFEDAHNFSEGLAAVQNRYKRYGYIRPDGTYLEGEFRLASDFSEGLAAVQNLYDGKYRYIRLDGTYLKGEFLKGEFKDAYSFSGGLAAVQNLDGKFRYMRPDGTYLEGEFEDAHSFSEGVALVQNLEGEFEDVYSFSEGVALVQNLDGKFRYMRPDGTYLEGEFEDAHSFSEGVALVQNLDGKFRYMRPDGTYLEGEFEDAYSFSEGVALVQGQNGEWRYIDHNGRQVFNRKLNH